MRAIKYLIQTLLNKHYYVHLRKKMSLKGGEKSLYKCDEKQSNERGLSWNMLAWKMLGKNLEN